MSLKQRALRHSELGAVSFLLSRHPVLQASLDPRESKNVQGFPKRRRNLRKGNSELEEAPALDFETRIEQKNIPEKKS